MTCKSDAVAKTTDGERYRTLEVSKGGERVTLRDVVPRWFE